jgi:hypothetical protein
LRARPGAYARRDAARQRRGDAVVVRPVWPRARPEVGQQARRDLARALAAWCTTSARGTQ